MVNSGDTFGMIKTLMDAHTMGIYAAAGLLRDCGYRVIIAPKKIEDAIERLQSCSCQRIIIDWIKENKVNNVGFSYRLDPDDAVVILGRFVKLLKDERLYECEGAVVKKVFFAGLLPACEMIREEYGGRIETFKGGETVEETLLGMGVPIERIPLRVIEGCKYDKKLLEFGKTIIKKGNYNNCKPLVPVKYPEYGTNKDRLVSRLDQNFIGGFSPLIRAHLGPYSPNMTREECLKEYCDWCRQLASSGYLDILSIGSSQLSQSNFGEDWTGKINGGGVPVNSELEYRDIRNAANPMLVRTYSATKDIVNMANLYERSINIAWHALSFLWFDELDGRGPNSLYENLKEHVAAIKCIARIGKPVEANVSHHFAFRGCDDVTYIVSAYIAAKMIKQCGVKTFILQNMLNTPRSTWGVQDIAKSRALLKLVNELRDDNFRVILQTRAGLDYFRPDLEQAKEQLAAVTAMMDDIDYYNEFSPEIIHVVSYSEALFLATPQVLDESIKITRTAFEQYRNMKKCGYVSEANSDNVATRTARLESSARAVIKAMEDAVPNLYSPEGLYIAFVGGWLPTPELWNESDEFEAARKWSTKMQDGGKVLVDGELLMSDDARINKCVSNIPDAIYKLRHKSEMR